MPPTDATGAGPPLNIRQARMKRLPPRAPNIHAMETDDPHLLAFRRQTGRMRIRFGCEFEHQASESTPSLWQIRARPDGPHRVLHEELSSPTASSHYLDVYGNICDRFLIPEGSSTLRYEGTADVTSELDDVDRSAAVTDIVDLPDEALLYLMPSRFCWPDFVQDFAWEQFGGTKPTWERVEAISQWIFDSVTYTPGASNSSTSAFDTFETRVGVCRDFSQLGVTLCRALNIPARYVAGYLPDIGVEVVYPMDFCSWGEAWLDGKWWTFDPRNNKPRVGRVVVARGRDALDTAMVTTWGNVELLRMDVWAIEDVDD
jgi:transglutaminase-like putative cysteine protease